MMPLSMRVVLSFVLCIVLYPPFPVNAEATKEKCTCDLATENDRQDGAEVPNASACFLTTYTSREWCIFDVDSLKSSSRHEDLVAQLGQASAADEPNAVVTLLFERFEQWSERGEAAATLSTLDSSPEHVLGEIEKRLNEQSTLLLFCSAAFAAGTAVEELQGESSFRCGVHPSGWLTVAFDFEWFYVFYLLGPSHDRSQ